MFVEKHGLLSGIDIAQYSINKPLKLCWIKMQMGGAYTMVKRCTIVKNDSRFISVTKNTCHISYSFMNLFKQTRPWVLFV